MLAGSRTLNMMTTSVNNNLARILTVRQFLTDEDQNKWIAQAETEQLELDQILLNQNVFGRKQLLKILENHFFVPSCDLSVRTFDPKLAQQFPEKLARRHLVFPLDKKDDSIRIMFANPDDKKAREAVERIYQKEIVRVVALPSDLINTIEDFYAEKQSSQTVQSDRQENQQADFKLSRGIRAKVSRLLADKIEGKSQVDIVNEVLAAAIKNRATDIHLQPSEKELNIRFRLDGVLHTVARLPVEIAPAVISRVKVLSNMDLAEHRLPQDGRHSIERPTESLDLRVSLLPSQFGEKIVIRLLRKHEDLFVLDNLQMPRDVRTDYQDLLQSPQGFFLVTGPTGSGKTTTLYATLNSINNEADNVVTLEDPIEYSFNGLTQVQIREDIGLTFASGLRSILRQDPDVVLVGEIRDKETADIACRAALTGHKVFSTLHTNDACQAITRLLDLGTPAFLIAATLRGVLAQRLVRIICFNCRESYQPSELELMTIGRPDVKELFRGRGCEHCNYTGYRGRKAIFEYFQVSEDVHRLIIERASPYVIRHFAKKSGMRTMRDYAIADAIRGVTSLEEIQRTVLFSQEQEQLCPNCMQTVSLEFSICPFCQNPLRERCENCGQVADPNWEACPNCGHQFEREWEKKYCQNCLAPVKTEWESCAYCGAELS